jgi:hypothetical protein
VSGRTRVILLELACLVVIAASVVALGIPKAAEIRRRGAAARVLDDVEVMRNAVYQFYSDSAYFPQQLPSGLMPEGLEPYLPRNFSMRRAWGVIEYRHWPVAVRDSTTPAPSVIGVSLVARDPRVGIMAAARARAVPHFTVGNVHTWIFFGG